MPGNEVGDRIHNFFGQENLSRSQDLSQVVEGTWPGLGNNLWAAGQRQIVTPFWSNSKNNIDPQSANSDDGHGSLSVQHGINISQSTLKPEFSRGQFHTQRPSLNGYAHGHQMFQTRQNEANMFGMDSESGVRNFASRDFSVDPHSQLINRSETHEKNMELTDYTESPVNFDFFGGRQQIVTQHPGMLQSFPRQQSGINDMQILQQQVVLKQIQEFQHHQQFQKQQVRQMTFGQQAAGNHSTPSLVNRIPVQDVSNYAWQQEPVPANSWLQRSMSPAMQSSSTGFMFSPEQGVVPCSVSMVSQQFDQSLYGSHISGPKVSPNSLAPMQIDKPTVQQISGSGSSFSSNQFAGHYDQVGLQDGIFTPRAVHQERDKIVTPDGLGLNSGFAMEHLQQSSSLQNNDAMQEFGGRQDLSGPSEISQDKAVVQVPPPQKVATLDPTEERILFGSDDNLLDVFGKSADIGLGGNNLLDGTDLSGTFPSLQSGSWSALMQSAVAETSSGNIGTQEEWSGLNSLTGIAKDQQHQTLNDVGKQQLSWTDNGLQTSTLNSRSFPLAGNDNSHKPSSYVAKVNHSRVAAECLQASSSQRSIEQFLGEGTKWQQTEVSQGFGQVSHSSEAELNARASSGSWTGQQNIPFYNVSSNEHFIKSNGLNFMNAPSPSAFGGLKNELNSNTLHTQMSGHRNPMSGLMGHDGGTWKPGSVASPLASSYLVKPVAASPQFSRDSSGLNNIAAAADFGSTGASPESKQQIASSGNIDVWKNVSSSVTAKWSDVPGKGQLNAGMANHQYELSRSNSLANGTVEMHEKQNSHAIEKRNDTIGVRESDGIDSCGFPGGKQNSSCQSLLKASAGHRFQYHPMGDVDVSTEPSHGTKQVMHTQSVGQLEVSQGLKNFDQGFMNQLKVPGHTVVNSMGIDKAHAAGLHGEKTVSDEMPAKGILAGSGLGAHASFHEAVHRPAANRIAMSSQNMLQLFHKEQSREAGNATQLSSSDGNRSSYMPELRDSDVPFHLQQNQSSAHQGFGLQLGLSSQRLSTHEQAFSSQRLSQAVSIPSAVGEKGQTWLASGSSDQSLPLSHEVSGSSGQAGNNSPGNVLATLFPSNPQSKGHLQIQYSANAGGCATTSPAVNTSNDRVSSNSKQTMTFDRVQTNQSSVSDFSRGMLHEGVFSSSELLHPSNHLRDQKFPVLEAAPVRLHDDISASAHVDVASKGFPVTWTSEPAQQQSFDGQPISISSDILAPDLNSSKISEPPFRQQCQGQNVQTELGVRSESNACLATQLYLVGKEKPGQGDHLAEMNPVTDHSLRMMSASKGKEAALDHFTGISVSSALINEGETITAGNSLQPNNNFHQNSFTLHQVQGTENPEVNPYNRTLKKFKVAGSTVDTHSIASQGGQTFKVHDKVVQDGSVDEKSIPTKKSDVVNFSGKQANRHDGDGPLDGVVPLGRGECQKFVGSSNSDFMRTEYPQISPQMAPSRFDQYGTFKNGQIVPTYDSRKMAISKTMELPFTFGRPFDRLHAQNVMGQGNAVASSANHCAVVHNSSIPMPTSFENFSSSESLQADNADQNLLVHRPKKRKSANSELVSWQEEVRNGSQRINNISAAEAGWAYAVNRLTEKVEDEADMVEDVSPILRLKRRLILTTQLMQLLLHPPSASVLFADAFSNYDGVTHLVSRSTLGDACSTLCCSEFNTNAPANFEQHLQNQLRTSQKINGQLFLKVMNDLISRARKLENELSRLDKRMSVLDLRVELQDLEKFSVINRFAKFHGRGQADVAESSSSSDASTNVQRFFLQRYVTAVPMPRNLPDRVQCFSL